MRQPLCRPLRPVTLVVVCGRKDGVKKPAKSATSSDSANSKQPEPAPAPRILPGAIPGVTFRQIKKYVEIKKERQSMANVELEYRAPERRLQLPKSAHVATQEELEQAKRERELAAERKRQAELEADLERKRKFSRSAVVLLDGYNFLHAWEPTKRLLNDERIDEARLKGVHHVKDYAGFIEQKVVFVFDAHARSASAMPETVRVAEGKWVEIVYAAQEGSADAFIEKEVRALGSLKNPPRIVVVSNDNDLRTTASVSEFRPLLCSVSAFLDHMRKADENMREEIRKTGDGTLTVTAKKQHNRLTNFARGADGLAALRAQLVAASPAAGAAQQRQPPRGEKSAGGGGLPASTSSAAAAAAADEEAEGAR